jgi:polyisoprenyl-teichoic acid--peptidoglycan teichoic acid transferase
VQERNTRRGRTLVILLLGVSLGILSLLMFRSEEMREVTGLALGHQSSTSITDTEEVMNIAVLGVGGEGHAGGSLTDTIMLASINLKDGSAVLFSIPRDLYLRDADGSGQRINAALAAVKSVATDSDAAKIKAVFSNVFSVRVDHFVRLDFQAFVQAVDAVGGIELEFTEPLHDANFEAEYGILDYQPGVHLLDGRAALYVSRSRMTSTRGDIDRAARQRAILTAFSQRLANLEGLATPTVMSELAKVQRQHVQTDLGIVDLIRLYQVGKSMSVDDISRIGIEDSPEPLLEHATIAGATVLVPRGKDMAAINQFMHRSIFGAVDPSDTPG